MKSKLVQQLAPVHLVITDNSRLHAGHAEMRGNRAVESHFAITVVSEGFKGLSPVERHRLVYKHLAEELSSGVHALEIKAKTPEEYSKMGGQLP
jgi:BolA protein